MKKLLCLLISVVMLFTGAFARSDEEFLSVTDNAHILSDATERYIYTQNKTLFEETGARIIFCTEKGTGELSVTEYADSMYEELGVSNIGRNNSVFVFVSLEDKDYTVKVGEGISASLTIDKAQKHLIKYMEKDFDSESYDKAVINTFNAFGKWYVQKYGIDLALTDDMSAYKNIVKTERNERRLKNIIIGVLAVAVAVALFTTIIHIRRKRRMARLRRRRQERRRRYNLAKHGDKNVRL